MLEVLDLHTYYGDSYILQGVSIRVPKGNIVAVLGRNGVGKTTLIHSIVAFVKPRKGSILLEGAELMGKTTQEIMRSGIALVPQGRRIFPSLSVLENLVVPFRCSYGDETAIKPMAMEEVFRIFPILKTRQGQKARFLSGGEQQMLAMARALVSGPKILLMDEPSEGLAPLIVQEISDVISGLREQRMGLVLVEQNFQMATRLADNVYVMSRGNIVHESTPQELVANEEIKSRYLGM
ncbi:ABC transporter ATP-binding protein [Desulfatiglans anilini]|uniref:ABC transporter ATP-binding protein n=1 Tax=Desulfatiglans anilini TaxID=90728 RepID=UPI0003FFA643|nr:ABC transporter ATP-binding protein [Desulfatiglans anilini]